MLKNQEHRENLLKLIKMMKGVYNENIADNTSRGILDSELKQYISYERLLSIRELTKMFIEELNSEYLRCSESDEIFKFIEDTIEWLQLAYNYIIENNSGCSGVKSLKICSQSLNDYKKVYEDAKNTKDVKIKGKAYVSIKNSGAFEFGKRYSHKVEFDETGMTVNDGRVYIHDDPQIISPEYTKKLNEIYEWIKEQKKERIYNKNYYLSFDVSREGTNHGILFEETNDSELKIVKFIQITTNRLDEVADKLMESAKGIYNCKIIIPTINIGQSVVDYLKEKRFINIIELDLNDMRDVAINNKELIQNKDKLFKLIPNNYSNEDLIEFIKMSKELDNIDIEMYQQGRLKFKRKSMEVTSTRICAVFYALSKLGYKL